MDADRACDYPGSGCARTGEVQACALALAGSVEPERAGEKIERPEPEGGEEGG